MADTMQYGKILVSLELSITWWVSTDHAGYQVLVNGPRRCVDATLRAFGIPSERVARTRMLSPWRTNSLTI